jgi:inhibitor of cysteine peptidase
VAKASLTITLTEAGDGTTVKTKPGDMLVLHLRENASTGYRWAFDALDEAKLELVKSEYVRESDADNAAMGSGGEMIWTLNVRPKSKGRTPLKLKLWRSFEGDKSIQQRFAITLRIANSPLPSPPP